MVWWCSSQLYFQGIFNIKSFTAAMTTEVFFNIIDNNIIQNENLILIRFMELE